jgi:Ca2+-binding EF-hand superfamily protein
MRADVDGDGVVSILDLSRVAQSFGQAVPPAPARSDQDGDGVITILDLSRQARVFGEPVTLCP